MEFFQQKHNSANETFGCHVVNTGYTTSAAVNTECARYRNDFQIIYIRKGSGTVNLNNTQYPLHDDSLLLYRPMEYQEYKIFQTDERELYWLYFEDIRPEMLSERFGIPEANLFTVSDSTGIYDTFRNILWEVNNLRENTDLMLSLYTGQLLTFISRFTMLCPLNRHPDGMTSADTVKNIRKEIEKDYMTFVKVKEYATRCSLSTTRFIHIFREQTGMTPIAYRQKIRLDKAMLLLSSTDRSIQDIAVSVGFGDSLYFSKVFKKHTGLSPSQYRAKFISR